MKNDGTELQLYIYKPLTTTTYGLGDFYVGGLKNNPTGQCGPSNADGSGGMQAGSTITITAVDASHIAGTFNVTMNGEAAMSGGFDVPFCQPNPGLNPQFCCIP